jgi:hypothetical protein
MAKIRPGTEAIRAETKAFHERRIAKMDAPQESTTTCQETAENEPESRMMQSIEERQEIPKGEAAVMLVGERRKWCRVCNLAAERRQKRKGKTCGNRG